MSATDVGSKNQGFQSAALSHEAILKARQSWAQNGYAISPGPLVSGAKLEELRPHVEAVFCGEYETGVPPYNNTAGHPQPHPPFVEVAMAHLANRAILEFVHEPELGRWAAEVLEAKWIQIWNVQLMKKQQSEDSKAVVGWHQDDKYLSKIVTGDTTNLWLALEEATPEHGPVRFVRGSHRWPKSNTSFFHSDTDRQRREIGIPTGEVWEEVIPWVPAGYGTVHHRMTLHGSGVNRAESPRLNIILHLRSEKSQPVMDSYYMKGLNDPKVCPVIYDRK